MNLKEFINMDYNKTLFPLSSIKIFSEFGLNDIINFINEEIFQDSWLKNKLKENYPKIQTIIKNNIIETIDRKMQSYFLMQPWVYALKDKTHYRQTFLLDPIAQIFLYDFVHRNIYYFQNETKEKREIYGYYFENEKYNSPSEEYEKFTKRIYELKNEFDYFGKVDISNYFNNIYHHDIVSFLARKINQMEAEKFGKFLREINEGRSTSCMPQGLFPVKIIGNFFLNFIDESVELKSEYIIRFMDDIYFFSDSKEFIEEDIIVIQKLLGDKGLYLNEEKTKVANTNDKEVREQFDEIKKSLLQKRRLIINTYSDEMEDASDDYELTDEERDYLKKKLYDKHLEDQDIELILILLSTADVETVDLIKLVLYNAPHLTKNLYHNIKRNYMELTDDIIMLFEDYIEKDNINEYQLFWITKIIIDFTVLNESIAKLLIKIYKHPSSSNVVKCVILEIQENKYGFLELKKKIVRGHAPELVISAMVGLIGHEKGNRNQIYKYVGKSNPVMRVLTLVLKKLDSNSTKIFLDEHFEKFIYQGKDKTDGNDSEYIDDLDDIFADDDLPF